MTFEEMRGQAVKLGYSGADMIRNCTAQLAQYHRLSKAPNDQWDAAAKHARECLKWITKGDAT